MERQNGRCGNKMVNIKKCNFKYHDISINECKCRISTRGNGIIHQSCCGEENCVIYQIYYILAMNTNGKW